MRPSKILTLGGPLQYVDTFAVTPARLVPVVGTLAVSGGALQAASAGDWLGNIVVNNELTTDTTGWIATSGASIARVDSGGDPGANSGGADKWVLKITSADGSEFRGARFAFTAIQAATYRAAGRAFAPSTNTGTELATLNMLSVDSWVASSSVRVAAEDAWLALSGVQAVANTTSPQLRLGFQGSAGIATGDVIYGDSFFCYRQNTPALVAGWQSSNFVATLDHISPAAGVVPFSKMVRYTDPLNYWEVRVLPNTAGDDLTIWQITNGVETPRAAADVDWTSNGLDQLRVVAEGAVIGTEHKKAGAGSWTTGPSWSAATQGQGAPGVGVMFWGTGTGRLAAMEVVAR